jgi:hypothetical protein
LSTATAAVVNWITIPARPGPAISPTLPVAKSRPDEPDNDGPHEGTENRRRRALSERKKQQAEHAEVVRECQQSYRGKHVGALNIAADECRHPPTHPIGERPRREPDYQCWCRLGGRQQSDLPWLGVEREDRDQRQCHERECGTQLGDAVREPQGPEGPEAHGPPQRQGRRSRRSPRLERMRFPGAPRAQVGLKLTSKSINRNNRATPTGRARRHSASDIRQTSLATGASCRALKPM